MQESFDLVVVRIFSDDHVHFGNYYIFNIDNCDFGEFTTNSHRDTEKQASLKSMPRQKVTSSPNVGSTGNIDIPDLTGGFWSYS